MAVGVLTDVHQLALLAVFRPVLLLGWQRVHCLSVFDPCEDLVGDPRVGQKSVHAAKDTECDTADGTNGEDPRAIVLDGPDDAGCVDEDNEANYYEDREAEEPLRAYYNVGYAFAIMEKAVDFADFCSKSRRMLGSRARLIVRGWQGVRL